MTYLCDTNILIEYLRGNESVRDMLLNDKRSGLGMSTISMMELVIGAYNNDEVRLIKKTFADYKIVEVNEKISILARNLCESYSKSHNLQIPDAIIAATAITEKIPLGTFNVADFAFIPHIKLRNIRKM
jgi:predicted nucleic acid-binding protein